MPVKIAAHHAKLLWGYGQMEQSLLSSQPGGGGPEGTWANCAWPRSLAAPFELISVLRSAETDRASAEKIAALPNYATANCFRRRRSWC